MLCSVDSVHTALPTCHWSMNASVSAELRSGLIFSKWVK